MGRALRKHQYGRNQRWTNNAGTCGLFKAEIFMEVTLWQTELILQTVSEL